MSDIQLAIQSTPTTPSAGNAIVYVDTTAAILAMKNAAGLVRAQTDNASVAALTVNAADTYVTDSDLLIPAFGLQVRSKFYWQMSMSKTGAGVAQPIISVRIGSARTTSDTARLAITTPAQTAVADVGTLNIMCTVRTIGATGVIQGTAWWDHRGTAASSTIGVGFANDGSGHTEATAAGFDMTTSAGNFVGISLNSGTSGVWTVTQSWANAAW